MLYCIVDGACPVIPQSEASGFSIGAPLFYDFFSIRVEEYHLIGSSAGRFIQKLGDKYHADARFFGYGKCLNSSVHLLLSQSVLCPACEQFIRIDGFIYFVYRFQRDFAYLFFQLLSYIVLLGFRNKKFVDSSESEFELIGGLFGTEYLCLRVIHTIKFDLSLIHI